MAERIRKLTNSEVEVLARIIADTMTGSQMNEIFQECGVQDVSNESTKWKRIYYTFLARQEQDGASNSFLNFIKKSLKPVRFISGQNGNYDEILLEINKPLMLIGLQMTNEGKLLKVQAATTISEVERRTRNLVSELQKRHIHQDVIKCCKEEYLQENYFHAVFEAAKSLSEKVREKTGMQEDGSNLFNNAFAVNNPRLAINSLQTPSEKNAQNGLKEMLNGVTHMVRNVTAHVLTLSGAEEHTALRVQPLDETYRELSRKYLRPIGFEQNNMFIVDWSEDDFGALNFYDMYDILYPKVNGQYVPYIADDNLAVSAVYRIPKEEFESVIMKYFNIDSETLQSKTVYYSEDSTYEYKPRGFEEVEYPEYPYSEVVDFTENSDGTITLTANVVFPYAGDSKVYAHEVVVRPLEDGGVQYVSNQIIPSEDNYEETWHTPRLTLEEWEELYGGE